MNTSKVYFHFGCTNIIFAGFTVPLPHISYQLPLPSLPLLIIAPTYYCPYLLLPLLTIAHPLFYPPYYCLHGWKTSHIFVLISKIFPARRIIFKFSPIPPPLFNSFPLISSFPLPLTISPLLLTIFPLTLFSILISIENRTGSLGLPLLYISTLIHRNPSSMYLPILFCPPPYLQITPPLPL